MTVMVETAYGRVQGLQERGVCVWRSVPYAKAPVGERRFRPPEAPEPWAGVRDATRFGPVCVQVENPLNPWEQKEQSEDCLSLNIWSPAADGAKRPVMVWIHGGAYVFGSGQSPWYDGTSFARSGDVVVVTINYRLGPFGFLYLGDVAGEPYAASGNCALLDQVAALRWVKENIAAFGGDPDNVTVAGESAGAWSVGALMAMPQARGLFHKAILQSGIPISFLSKEQAMQTTHHILAALGLEPGQWHHLLEVPARDLLAAAQKLPPGGGMALRPVLDGVVFAETFWNAIQSGSAAGIPTLLGTNQDELMLWAGRNPRWRKASDEEILQSFAAQWGPLPDQARAYYLEGRSGTDLIRGLVRLGTMSRFEYPTMRAAELQSAHAPVYMYRFDFASTARGGVLGAAHALEIPFVFNTIHDASARALIGEGPDHPRVAAVMHEAWTRFMHQGVPAAAGLPAWPQYEPNRRATMVFDAQSHVEEDPHAEERQLWSTLVAW